MRVQFRQSFTRDLGKLPTDLRACVKALIEQVEGDLVTFVRVLHRKEIYRYFP